MIDWSDDNKLYPKNNWDLMENNDVGANAAGGTERYMRFVYNGAVPREVLEQVQIIPSRLRDLKEDKIRVYFEHNLPNDPESQKAYPESMRNNFHKIVFLSNWQYQQFQNYLGLPYSSQSIVIEGGFEVDDKPLKKKTVDLNEQLNVVYNTTPHRGLEILVPVFLKLAENDPKLHLHVHSSFKMYGWDQRDEQFEQLYKICREHPQITYHGFTDYYKLRQLMEDEYHVFAYPSIWAETMCRAVLEAMNFGCLCVHPNLAAMPDTTGCLNPFMYAGTSNHQEHAHIFYHNMLQAIGALRDNGDAIKNLITFNKMYIFARYNSTLVHHKWTQLLQGLNAQYPTIESRKFPKEMLDLSVR